MAGPRFFIGSGEGCDLRLGGDILPSIHSLIQTRADGIWLEAVAENPPLLLNGHITKGEWLRDGDLLEIGPFQLVAHVIPVQTQFKQEVAVTPPPASATPLQETIEVEEPNVAELSASELVDLIEKEQAMVEEFEQNRRAGAEALLQAIRKRQRTLATVPRVSVSDSEAAPAKTVLPNRSAGLRQPVSARASQIDAVKAEERQAAKVSENDEVLLHDLEHLCKELNELSQELERRSLQADQREATFATAAITLLNAQRHLKAQIDVVAEQVAALNGRSKEAAPSRAIA